MRILFASLPASGHTYPLVPLALAAQECGHEVLLATAADFTPRLRSLGLATVDVGISMLQAFTGPALGTERPRSPEEMITSAGCGDVFAYGTVTPDAVRESATALLRNESIHNAVLALAREIASMPAPDEVGGQLETIVADLRS